MLRSLCLCGSLLLAAAGCHQKGGTPAPATPGAVYYCARQLPSGPWQVYKKNLLNGAIDTIAKSPAYNYWWVEASPDASQLLLLRSPYGSTPDQFNYAQCELVRAAANGTGQQVLLPDNANGWYAFGNPHWHPSGNRILLLAQPGTASSGPFYAATIDTNGQNPKLLTTQYTLDANWAPQGNKIVYIGLGATGSVPLNFEVFTADYDYAANQVSNARQLTSDNTRDQDPCFSPDGRTIAFSAGNALLTTADLVTIDASGANRKAVVSDGGVHGGPLNWGTDGRIYFHSIYLLTTGFMADAYDTKTGTYENLLRSNSSAYISPYYTGK
ncbi:hypothetical protein Q5H92_13565 [Hymenobacter sp. M29]|uniref:WD40-like Beta Propeller Repeat n=1 Tax=Hymenobacter mellowenesis TaxID=3063995 RepID=A0ABT9AC19_9BACT|nr:hypothetical protein [Hymenobacter sp. M29]MDO7847392.1 hypothetical protein [Hymenobacter sp. M29]